MLGKLTAEQKESMSFIFGASCYCICTACVYMYPVDKLVQSNHLLLILFFPVEDKNLGFHSLLSSLNAGTNSFTKLLGTYLKV